MKTRTRRVWLAIALVATGVAAVFAPPKAVPDSAVSDSSAAPVADLPVPRPAAPRPLVSLAGDPVMHERTDEDNLNMMRAFIAEPPAVPPAPPASAVAVPPVQAPVVEAPKVVPAPAFRVVGRYLDSGRSRLFVVVDGRNVVVGAGDKIGGDYQVDAISDTELTVHYLPMNVAQSIALNGLN